MFFLDKRSNFEKKAHELSYRSNTFNTDQYGITMCRYNTHA